ncbi:KRAB-A domain-containing protein 2-like, partial [Aphis craccivora]
MKTYLIKLKNFILGQAMVDGGNYVKRAIVKQPMNRKLVIKPITTADFNKRAQIDLVDFQSVPDGKFKWILNYQDQGRLKQK